MKWIHNLKASEANAVKKEERNNAKGRIRSRKGAAPSWTTPDSNVLKEILRKDGFEQF